MVSTSKTRLLFLLCFIAPIFAQDGTGKISKMYDETDNSIGESLVRQDRALPIIVPSIKLKVIHPHNPLKPKPRISLPTGAELTKVVNLGIKTYLSVSRIVGKLVLSAAFALTGLTSKLPRVVRDQVEVIVGMVTLQILPILGLIGGHFFPLPVFVPILPKFKLKKIKLPKLKLKLPKLPKLKLKLPKLPKLKKPSHKKPKPKSKLKLPKLKIPKLKLPKLKIPKLKLPKLKLPKLKIPKLKLPKLKLPKLKIPKLKLPKLKLPKLKIPKLKLPKLKLKLPKLPKFKLPKVKLPKISLKPLLKLRPRIVLEPGFIFPKLRFRIKPKVKIAPEVAPNLDLSKYGLSGFTVAPGLSKAQVKEFTEEFMSAILPEGVNKKVQKLLGGILAPRIAKTVPKVLKFMQLPEAVQQALALPFQFIKGGKKISSLNLGNRPNFEVNLHRDVRSLRVKRKSDQELIKFLLDQLFNLAQQSTNNQKLSSIQETFTALGINAVIPIANIYSHLPPFIQQILQLPFHLDRIIPKISIDGALWRIQALPVRIIQALVPLLSNGNISVFLILKSLIPLPIRLILAILPLPSGKYQFPKKFAGLLPDKALPKLQVQLPDGEFKAISKLIPYLLHLPTIELPDKIYDKIEDNIPNKIKYIKTHLDLPTIHIKPFSIFWLFPEYSVDGGKNQKLRTAMSLLELTGPLVFITLVLNPLQVPGALFAAAILSIPALIEVDPLRWLDPFILFGTKKGTGKGSII